MNPDKGLWLYLWNGDDHSVRRFVKGLHEMGISTPGTIVVPEGVRPPDIDWMPKGWTIGMTPANSNYEWLGLLRADCCAEVSSWDTKMLADAHPWRIVASVEAATGDWRRAALLIGMDLIRTCGGADKIQLDETQLNIWVSAAMRADCFFVRTDAQIGRATPGTDAPPAADPEQVETLTAKVINLRERYGVRKIEPNYKGVRLFIGVPTHSGRPEAVFQNSKDVTLPYLIGKGVHVEYGREMYNADIGLARARLASEFLKSTCTHMLQIDDDMGWTTSAIDRLIFADKPIVAVAGPKKSYPLKFAATHMDEKGEPLPIVMNNQDGCAEVSLVGCAFMLTKREAIEKMALQYPELIYVGNDGKESFALYTQFVRNKFYYPEDFAFCQRWRDMGGKIYICPDVRLQHAGTHVFEGSLLENAMRLGNVRPAA